MKSATLKKRWVMFLSLLTATLVLGGCFHGKNHPRSGEMMFEYIAWKLDLSEEQQALLDDVHQEMQAIREQQQEQRKQDREAVINLVMADTLDTGAAMALLQQKQTTLMAKAPGVLEKIAALHATLTPEQKNIIIEKLNKMHQHH